MSRLRKITSGPEAAVCLASMFKSSLGVRHGLKCIVDGDRELFLRSASLVLQNLDIEHPVGRYLVNTCLSFHKRHGNGVKTLLFLIGSLMKMAVSQREKAIPVCDILSAMEEGVKQCQKVMEEVKLPVSDVIQSRDQYQCKIHSSDRDHLPNNGEGVKPQIRSLTGQEDCVRNLSRDQSMITSHKGTELPTKPTMSSGPPLHTDNLIQLSLKENRADSGHDLDWFFEDDPFIQLQNHNQKKSHGNSRSDFLDKKTKKNDSLKIEKVIKTCSHSDDSDFEDCFDDIPKVHKFELTNSESVKTKVTNAPVGNILQRSLQNSINVFETSNIVSDLIKPFSNCTEQKILAEEDEEDEFDSCFNVDYDNDKDTSLDGGQPTFGGQQVRGEGVSHPHDNGKISNDSLPGTKNLEMKLQDLLEGKTKAVGQKHKLVYNSSRHFKTVESTVDLLKKNESSLDQKGQSSLVTHSSNHGNLDQSLISQEQGLKYKGPKNVINIPAGMSQDRKDSFCCQSEVVVNKPPSRDPQDMLDTKTKHSMNPNSEGLMRKLDILLEKAKSQKVSGAMLQSRHFREIGQSMNDIESVQRSEVKGQVIIKNEKTCSEGLMLESDMNEAAKVCQPPEVQCQELAVLSQPGQGSEVKHWDRTEEEFGTCAQMVDSMRVKEDCRAVVSGKVSINSEMVCTCMIRQEVDKWAGLRGVARSVSHGNEEMMDALVDAAMSQWKTQGCEDISQARLTLDLLYCCVTLGPLATPQLVSGIVTTADVVNIPLVHQYKGRQLNTILINGDIKPTYHHIGYKRPLDVQKTMTGQDFLQVDKGSSWSNDVEDIIQKFSVTCLLVRGSICDEVKVICETLGVIALENVPYKALHVMCTATVTSMTTYLSMADKTNVCTSVSMEIYTEKRMMGYQSNFVKITCKNTPVQTCVLSHPTAGGGDLMEQDFWRCASVLSSLLCSGHVLPGGGRTEQLCSEALLSRSAAVTMENAVTSYHHLSYVLQDMAAVLHDYYTTVTLNTGQGHPDQPPIKGHSDQSPIQGHSGQPPIKGHGHTDASFPDKCQGYTNPHPIKMQAHTETDRTTKQGQIVYNCHGSKGEGQNQGEGQNGVLKSISKDYLQYDYQSEAVHDLKLPSNSNNLCPGGIDSQGTNIDMDRVHLSDFGGKKLLECSDNTSVIFDDYKSKLASIQTACDYVGTVLMCDSYIVTGLDQNIIPDSTLSATNFISSQLFDVIL